MQIMEVGTLGVGGGGVVEGINLDLLDLKLEE